MSQDGVAVAFEMILEEITAVEDQLSTENATAFRAKRFDVANKLIESGKHLEAFRGKLEALRTEWRSAIDVETRTRVKVQPGYVIAPHSKAAKTTLRVTLPSGRVLQRPTAASTLADVVQELGFEAVHKLGLAVSGVPLVDTKRHSTYSQERREAYFMTHSNTRAKKDLLERVAKGLGKSLKVEVV